MPGQPLGVQADTSDIGKTGPPQFTANGVTVMGDALKVPVATNWACPFCTVATAGLMAIDSSIRSGLVPPPQLMVTTVKRSVAESPRCARFIQRLRERRPRNQLSQSIAAGVWQSQPKSSSRAPSGHLISSLPPDWRALPRAASYQSLDAGPASSYLPPRRRREKDGVWRRRIALLR